MSFRISIAVVAAGLCGFASAADECPISEKLRGHENVEWTHYTAEGMVFTNLPRVLLVGDSITHQYRDEVAKLLKGRAYLSYWTSSYCVTSPVYMGLLGSFLDDPTHPYDVVHFNNGLHSLGTPVEAYEKRFREAVALVREKAPKARIVIATSTPLRTGKRAPYVSELNAVAARIAKEFGCEVDDLYATMEPLPRERFWADNCHFKQEGKVVQARQVAECCLRAATAEKPRRRGPWSRERAWKWYRDQPWMRGCNYLPASAANYTDMWQELGSEERFEEMEREFALAERVGFNVMRLIIHEQGFGVWYADHDGFMARFERWLALLDRHHMRAIVLLGNDCSRPKELWKLPAPGKQHFDWGYHGGRKVTQHGSFPDAVGYTVLDDKDLRPKFFEMCRELVGKYRNDDRIAFWNLWNEPGNNNRGELTCRDLRELFELCWEIDPKQPLAADVWTDGFGMGTLKGECGKHRLSREAVQKIAGECSDIISYHCYDPFEVQVKLIRDLRGHYGRPMVNTEWLARVIGCNVADCYPLFYLEKVGAVNWGLVAGNYQTYEPYEPMWAIVEKGGGQGWDLTKWYHDLFRPSHHPYDPKEIRTIMRFNKLADEDFAASRGR